ncbi:MAG: hypothetical protein ACK51B_02830, partial [bacterium]
APSNLFIGTSTRRRAAVGLTFHHTTLALHTVELFIAEIPAPNDDIVLGAYRFHLLGRRAQHAHAPGHNGGQSQIFHHFH